MTLESSKNMGGIGALLMVIGCLGFLGAYTGILSLIGVILVLISLNGLANHYGEKGIFNYALYGILTFIAGIVVTAAIAFVSLLGFLADIGITFETLMDPTALSRIDWPALLTLESVWAFLAGLLLALVVIFVVLVISSFLIKKSLDLTSAKTGVGMFHTAGLLLLIGAFLTIIIIGFLLIFIAMILLIVAFFRIRTQPTVASSPQPTPQQ